MKALIETADKKSERAFLVGVELKSHSAWDVADSLDELAELATTAEMAAAACGCEVAQIVKSLVFGGAETGRAHLLLVSGANRVHEKRAGKAIGEKLVRVDAAAARAATGYAIGGVSPMGHGPDLPIWIDEDLLTLPTLWAAGGAPRAVFPVTPADLLRATGGTVIKVT